MDSQPLSDVVTRESFRLQHLPWYEKVVHMGREVWCREVGLDPFTCLTCPSQSDLLVYGPVGTTV